MIQWISRFLFRHTFAIYLLHSFASFSYEDVFCFLLISQHNAYLLGAIKFMVVLIITMTLAPLFTRASSVVTEQVLAMKFQWLAP